MREIGSSKIAPIMMTIKNFVARGDEKNVLVFLLLVWIDCLSSGWLQIIVEGSRVIKARDMKSEAFVSG
jgi:hypothetical protein